MRGVIAPTKNILHLPCALHGTCTIIFFILFHILLISRDTWKLVCLEISEEAAKRPDSPEWKWQAGCRRMDGVPPAGKLAKTEPQCWAKTTIDWLKLCCGDCYDKLKIHGNCPGELTSVILQLEESTGSIAVDQIGRSIILYRPSTSKMKKRQEVAENARRFARAKEENARRFVKSEESFEERPRNSSGRRFVKSGSTFSSQQKRRPMASKGSSYSRG